jgi:phosphoglycolate phosphatase-like HAD superfamily hydrolase
MAHFTDIRALAFDLDGTLVDSAPGPGDKHVGASSRDLTDVIYLHATIHFETNIVTALIDTLDRRDA